MDAHFSWYDKRRFQRSFTTGISCFSYFCCSLSDSSQKAFLLLFVFLNTHPSLADKACVFRERLHTRPHCHMRLLACPTTQCNYFGSLCQSCSEFSLVFLCLCWFPQQLESCWEVLSLQLDVVYRLSSFQCPQYVGHQAQLFLWELPVPLHIFPPQTWVDSPPPQPPPTWLLRLKIAPSVLQCVLSSMPLLHSLHRWWMRHCFSSQCFSK